MRFLVPAPSRRALRAAGCAVIIAGALIAPLTPSRPVWALDPDVQVGGAEGHGHNWPPPGPGEPAPHCDQPWKPDAAGNCPPGRVHVYQVNHSADTNCMVPPPDFGVATAYGEASLYTVYPHPTECGTDYSYGQADCSFGTAVFATSNEGWNAGVHYSDAWGMYGGAPAACHNLMSAGLNYAYWQTLTTDRYFDDILQSALFGLIGVNEVLGADPTHIYCTAGGLNHQAGLCTAGYAVVRTSDCRAHEGWPHVVSTCGWPPGVFYDILWGSSPISLEWDDVRVESIGAPVMFSLDASDQSGWTLWRGSAKTPLLVYDPAHHGTITSKTQLFGNWTFGGKKLASLDSRISSTEWRDGFEALATLDANRDGRISGAERASLGLWFDKNQNGVSEPGEVVSLVDAGVSWIAIGPAVRNEVSKSVSVERGFERSTASGVKIGRAVDWYSAKFDEPAMLFATLPGARLDRETILAGINSSPLPAVVPAGVPARDETIGANPPQSSNGNGPLPFHGAWTWTLDDPHVKDTAAKDMGFIIVMSKGSRLKGVSLAVMELKGKKADGRAVAHFQAIDGSVEQLSDGRHQLTFNVLDREGIRITSQALVSQDGATITGRTTEVRNSGTGPLTINYSWKGAQVRGKE